MGSTQAIVRRNQLNSQLSTGPRSAGGKAIAKLNSRRHGLCANPAAGTLEDKRQFERLHRQLVRELAPSGVIEAGLLHQIAVALWRLQRATRIDAAISELAVGAVLPQRQEIQDWIRRINEAWRVEVVPETDPRLLVHGYTPRAGKPDEKRLRPMRLGLLALDRLREGVMMRCGAAITAMQQMIQDLVERLQELRLMFMGQEAEQLAWLLGDAANSFPLVEPSALEVDEPRGDSPILALISEARQMEGEELPIGLKSLVETRLTTLRQQQRICEDPATAEQLYLKQTAALLPDAATLDRLNRYQGQIERSLSRAVKMLAEVRGVTVKSLVAIVTGRTQERTLMMAQQEQACLTNAQSAEST
ncbi:MAG TPA: hypothetical protein VHP11_16110 [Tepidisphaeraceae bacterium]|nr:hypothetical protein [Tepidisphaeraceae bacterium]